MHESSILVVGMLLGMQHATEADHLAAMATLATRNATLGQALRQGCAWGIGHTLTLLLFGGAVFLLGRAISPGLERALETAVGIMLVLLGADVLRRLVRDGVRVPVPAHSHRAGPWPLRALAVGMMHGLAGSAALVVLSMQAAPALPLGLGYIVVFGVGSIAGMAMLSAAIALPLRVSAAHLVRLHGSMTLLIGAGTCVLGASVIAQAQFFA